MKIAMAQIDLEQGDFEKNLLKVDEFSKRAKDEGVQLIVFPEMFLCGFNYKKNIAYLRERGNESELRLCEIAKNRGIALCGSLPHLEEKDALPSNRFVFVNDAGKILSYYDKAHLFNIFHENKYVKAGNKIVVSDTPFGKIGFAICYDIRFPDLFVKMAKLDAKIIIISSAFPHPRSEHLRILARARAIENQCFVIAVNRGGSEMFKENKIDYFGMSAAIDPWGGIIAECPENEESMALADINIDEVENIRKKIPALADRRDDIY